MIDKPPAVPDSFNVKESPPVPWPFVPDGALRVYVEAGNEEAVNEWRRRLLS